jgi:hypothetical protein
MSPRELALALARVMENLDIKRLDLDYILAVGGAMDSDDENLLSDRKLEAHQDVFDGLAERLEVDL